jgi:hypothetical protein
MARYFFHLRDGHDELLDPEGTELPDKPSIEAAALRAARDTLSHDLLAGRLDLRHRIDVEDEAGTVVHTIELADSFETIR